MPADTKGRCFRMYTFDTLYNQKAMTAMAKALRKTIRKKHSRKSHIYGWIVIIFGLFLSVSGLLQNGFSGSTVITWIAILAILAVTFFEDSINGWIALRRILAGSERANTVFSDEGFVSVTELGKTEWNYDKIMLIADLPAYVVFIFSKNHAQVYDKATLTGGSVEEFLTFLTEKTGKEIHSVR